MTARNQNDINDAARIIADGGLVAMPTETVYGLAADATIDKAVARIFEAKSRPQFNPLIIHVASLDMAKRYVEFSPLAEKLGHTFWPGPLTLVLPRRIESNLSLLVSAGLDSVGVRMPNHALARRLIAAVDRPLAAPSANASGTISPTLADHVRASLGARVDTIIDGGACPVGVESTIVKITQEKDGHERATLLRPGGIARADIEAFIGSTLLTPAKDTIEAPGMMSSHYAPAAKLRLNADAPGDFEAFLGFGKTHIPGAYALNLSECGNLTEAAANLFSYLRQLDAICSEHGMTGIAAAPIPDDGLGEAINDRLVRAAAPRV